MLHVKNCPFCGAKPEVGEHYVRCTCCQCTTSYFSQKKDAIALWNNRHQDPDIPGTILPETDTAVFVDLDGTLAHWIPTTTPEELVTPGYFRSLPAYDRMVQNIKYLIGNGYNVYVLSAYMETHGDPVAEKKGWLDEYLPEVDEEHRIFCPCSASKWEVACNAVKAENMVLLDDYSKNLHDWVADSKGKGVGIKVMNGINGSHNTWKGKRIANSCSPEELIALICEGR